MIAVDSRVGKPKTAPAPGAGFKPIRKTHGGYRNQDAPRNAAQWITGAPQDASVQSITAFALRFPESHAASWRCSLYCQRLDEMHIITPLSRRSTQQFSRWDSINSQTLVKDAQRHGVRVFRWILTARKGGYDRKDVAKRHAVGSGMCGECAKCAKAILGSARSPASTISARRARKLRKDERRKLAEVAH